MTGFELNERLGKIHFWMMFIAFNSTFVPLFAIGFLGMPRRVVTYPAYLQVAQRLGLGLGLRARALDARLPRQLRLVAACSRAMPRRRTRGSRSRSSGSCPRRCRSTTSTGSRVIDADPYAYGDRRRRPHPRRPAGAGPVAPMSDAWPTSAADGRRAPSRPSDRAQPLGRGASSGPARPRSSSSRSSSPTSTCARSTPRTSGSRSTSAHRSRSARRSRSACSRAPRSSGTSAPRSSRRAARSLARERRASRSRSASLPVVIQIVEWTTHRASARPTAATRASSSAGRPSTSSSPLRHDHDLARDAPRRRAAPPQRPGRRGRSSSCPG